MYGTAVVQLHYTNFELAHLWAGSWTAFQPDFFYNSSVLYTICFTLPSNYKSYQNIIVMMEAFFGHFFLWSEEHWECESATLLARLCFERINYIFLNSA